MGRNAWTAVVVAWLGAVIGGFAWLAVYANTPGAAAHAPATWPTSSAVTMDHERPTLVMLAHPRCTCSRASLAELAELLARAPRKPRTYVVFIKPGSAGVEWEKTDLWRTAAALPGVTVLRDDDGVEARRFGAETSGQVFLYDVGGRLLYSGGTTGARGHIGDNLGRAAILAHLSGAPASRSTADVFGCSLFGDAAGDAASAETDDDHGHDRGGR